MSACLYHADALMNDEELAARLAVTAWEDMTRDSSDVASACGLAREGRAREIVADMLAAPVIELDLGDIIEIDSREIRCEPIVRVTAVRHTMRINTDATWTLETEEVES